ncbi:MAG TPA: hypothetical protein VFZ03_04020, partial [Dongiaceae bacterium]
QLAADVHDSAHALIRLVLKPSSMTQIAKSELVRAKQHNLLTSAIYDCLTSCNLQRTTPE